MRENKRGMDEEKRISIRNAVISALVILLFSGIIMSYYVLLDAEKRENIIKSGQIISSRTADQFSDYLDAATDAMRVVAYTFEDMIKRGDPEEVLLIFLEDQTNAVTATVFENTTGLYAYVDGEYLDGAGWTPDADYEPTERPWYIEAVKGGGKITMIEPYVDAQSGALTMTIAKLLDDGESVIAMDAPMDRIQQIVEEAVADGDSDIEMILDEHMDVIAHSDPAENGKRYADEKDNLAAALIGKMKETGSGYFNFDFDGKNYVAYASPIGNRWQSISVRNATDIFRPLRMVVALTIIIEIVVVLVLARVFRASHRRGRIAIRLNQQLSSIADIYRSAQDLDIVNDLYSEIETDERGLLHMLPQERKGAREMILEHVEEDVDPDSKEEVKRFVDFSTLDERMGDYHSISTEFMNKEQLWLRGRFIVSQRLPDGKLSHVIWVVENIDQEKKDRERLRDLSERAIAENEARNAFLSRMSHEIRTPINAVLGMNEMILREAKDRDILSYAGDIREAGYELLDLINDLLACTGDGDFALSRLQNDPEGKLEEMENTEEKEETREQYQESFYAPDVRLLAVDDNPINLKVFAGLLKKCGMRIDMATGGKQALELAAAEKYDMIFLDHMMPEMDGVETLHGIRARKDALSRDAVVICLTANAIDGAREQYIAEGFDDYLPKPVDPRRLEEMLKHFLPAERLKDPAAIQEITEKRPDGIPVFVEQIAELDLPEGIRYSGGEEGYLEMLELFSESAEQYADGIEEAIAASDYNDAAIRIHALKSSLRIIGARDAGELAQKLEMAAKDNDLRTLNRQLESLLTRCRLIGQALSRLKEETETKETQQKQQDEGVRRRLLEKIRECAEERDNLGIEELLAEFGEHELAPEEKTFLSKMQEAAAEYDFEKLRILAESGNTDAEQSRSV
ncbi:MAG: response regulator [Lachnospiraceae bacterium]|nr:response regulator [Lachnospiraceae bacterium]